MPIVMVHTFISMQFRLNIPNFKPFIDHKLNVGNFFCQQWIAKLNLKNEACLWTRCGHMLNVIFLTQISLLWRPYKPNFKLLTDRVLNVGNFLYQKSIANLGMENEFAGKDEVAICQLWYSTLLSVFNEVHKYKFQTTKG